MVRLTLASLAVAATAAAADPNRWVYPGFQSWEEMMAPNLGCLVDRDADIAGLMSVTN